MGGNAGQLVTPSRPETAPPGRAGVLLAVCLGVGVATLNSTVANIALPQIGKSLQAGLAGLQWVANAYMLTVAGWRGVFALVAVVGVATSALGRRLISPARHGRPAQAGQARPPDVAGATAITVVLSACSFALIDAQSAGWASPPVLAGFAAAALALAAFPLAEHASARRGREPLVPPGAWRIPRFTAASLGGLVYGLALFGLLFYLSLFLQQVQGRSALQTGLVFLPLSGTMAVAGPLAGWLTGRYGQRATAAAGTAVAAAGVLCLAVIGPAESVASLAWRLAVAGIGMGLMSTPLSSATIAALPEDSAGFASAMYNSSRQVGGVLGIALLGVLLAAGQAAARASAAGPGLAFTHGLRLALIAAGLALAASAATSAMFLRGAPQTKRTQP